MRHGCLFVQHLSLFFLHLSYLLPSLSRSLFHPYIIVSLYATRVSLFSTPIIPPSFSLTLSLPRLHHCLSLRSLTFSNFKLTTLISHLSHTDCHNTPLSHSHSGPCQIQTLPIALTRFHGPHIWWFFFKKG